MGKRFYFEVIQGDDGMFHFNSEGQGFHTFEVLGFFDWKREDIIAQIRGDIKPDVVKRTVVIEGKE